MNDYAKSVDVKEMGRRFKLVRQKLGMTQIQVARELDTSQLMIFRIEKGENVLSPFFLGLLMFYSQSVSLEGLLAKKFDIEDESLFNKTYSLNSVVKTKLSMFRDEMLAKLDEAEKEVREQLKSSIDML